MYHDHEDDHGLYAFANEYQAAFAVSQLTHDYGTISIPAGMFAVVSLSPAYCSRTDAALPGSNMHVVRLACSRRLADYFARRLVALYARADGDYVDEDTRIEVWPKVAYTPPARTVEDGSVPF